MSGLRERRIREREQIFRECGSRIESLSIEAAKDIEKKYREMYGENWRQSLPYESSCRLEESIKNEKMLAVARIQDYFIALKSNTSSNEEVSFRR